ncbi:hypothetical protein CAPTEDRAFT_218246 [Capitella teleta]|uniref:Uncharacterized protein n=1 Tax=Capitella teleta TaxID=283909 RepID=R7V4Q7_CAPTE|nr:hypothetical protein CAPTEDRAFT_218246 [Capitella teleta]|eukprot:ELU13549.1 hypothetical protein CAPTEDRAFT_218246 [Capitella teleta]
MLRPSLCQNCNKIGVMLITLLSRQGCTFCANALHEAVVPDGLSKARELPPLYSCQQLGDRLAHKNNVLNCQQKRSGKTGVVGIGRSFPFTQETFGQWRKLQLDLNKNSHCNEIGISIPVLRILFRHLAIFRCYRPDVDENDNGTPPPPPPPPPPIYPPLPLPQENQI